MYGSTLTRISRLAGLGLSFMDAGVVDDLSNIGFLAGTSDQA